MSASHRPTPPGPVIGLTPSQHRLKRLFDLAVAVPLLVIGLPLLLILGAALLLTSGAPILFRQRRVTLAGRPFTMLKLRTMVPDAEAATGPVWAVANDSRCTVLGRWLRLLSLDELPQLWNVIRGEMSLVGPRPERPVFVARFEKQLPGYSHRHRVKAGVTGWAQVNGWRGDTALGPRLEHDLEYLERWSLWLDVQILWRTACGGFIHRQELPLCDTDTRSDRPDSSVAGASTT